MSARASAAQSGKSASQKALISLVQEPVKTFSNDELLGMTNMVLRKAGVLSLITSPTGTGKSTRLPPYVIRFSHQHPEVGPPLRSIVIVPTIESARRLYEEVSHNYPDLKVGFAAEAEKHYGPESDLVYATSGHARRLLMQKFQTRKATGFDEFTLLFLDEIHTGSVDNSLIIGMWKYYIQEHLGPIPRLVLMSATPVLSLLGKTSLRMETYTVQRPSPFEVRIQYLDKAVLGRDLLSNMVELAANLHLRAELEKQPGHILIFVAGVAQALMVEDRLQAKRLPKAEILSIYSTKDRQERKRAFQAMASGFRLILVATNVIESSVTVAGLKFVIDSMQEKRPGKSATGGMLLEEHLISKNSAEQRAGRTGRTCPGVVYRMITQDDYQKLAVARPLDIQQVPIHNEILDILEVGRSPVDFMEILPPDRSPDDTTPGVPEEEISQIVADLVRLEMVTRVKPYQVTEVGKFATRYPLGIRSSAFLWGWLHARRRVEGEELSLPPLAGIIIAALIDNDPSRFFIWPRRHEDEPEPAFEARRAEYVSEKFSRFIGGDYLVTILNLWNAIQEDLDLNLVFPEERTESDKGKQARRGRNAAIRKWCQANAIAAGGLFEVVKVIKRCIKITGSEGWDISQGTFTSVGTAAYARPLLIRVNQDMTMDRIPDRNGYYLHKRRSGFKSVYRLALTGIPGPLPRAGQLVAIVTQESGSSGRVFRFIKMALAAPATVVEPVPAFRPAPPYPTQVTPESLGFDLAHFRVPRTLAPPTYLAAGRLQANPIPAGEVAAPAIADYRAVQVALPTGRIYGRLRVSAPRTTPAAAPVVAEAPPVRRLGIRASRPVVAPTVPPAGIRYTDLEIVPPAASVAASSAAEEEPEFEF